MIRCILKKFRLDNDYYKLLLDSDWHQLNIRRPNNPDPRYQWEIRSTKRELFQVLLLTTTGTITTTTTTTAYIVSHIIEVIKIQIVIFIIPYLTGTPESVVRVKEEKKTTR